MRDRTILHSDMNCCFASIEHLYHPELHGKPLAVGGDPQKRHGIVLTADYIAKRYGVKTGMALWQARQCCPSICFVPPNMDRYLRFSRLAQEIYSDYTDRIEPFGIDESWLDVTESAELKGDGERIAQEISRRIREELGITVSIGVSFDKVYAKLGSDYKKPDAITTMYREEIQRKAWRLPVDQLLYVGRSTNRKFRKIGIDTIGDLARADTHFLEKNFGKIGIMLWAFANGYDDSPVCKKRDSAIIKSIGNSTTAPVDLLKDEDIKIVFYTLAESVGSRLRENGFLCRVIEISVRDTELDWCSRQRKLDIPTNVTEEIATQAFDLFKHEYKGKMPIRSLGIRGSELMADRSYEQLYLFETDHDKQQKMDLAVDDIRRRYGYYSIQRGIMYMNERLSALDAKEEHQVHPHGFLGGRS